jgi:DNA-binding NarL/FixJ family response regulator
LQLLLAEEGIELVLQSSLITLPLTIRTIDPDLILLDLHMPVLSGANLFHGGMNVRQRTAAPIVLFSGADPRELSRKTEELGADGFLSKVMESDEFIQTIWTWTTKKQAFAAANRGGSHATRASSAAAH